MSSASATSQIPPVPDRWLFGPVRDLVFGCGLGYAGILLGVLTLGQDLQRWLPTGLLILIVMFANTPHYGATLLRVYEQRENRRRYAVFSVWISLALALAFVAACYWYDLGSWLLTVYLNWSPWHYAGQNYGIALMFLHRRGVNVPANAKKMLYASFILAFLLTLVKVNGGVSNAAYGVEGASATDDAAGPVYQFISMGIQPDLQSALMTFGFGAYLIATMGAFRLLFRHGRASDLLPSVLIVASQSLWFVVPAMFQSWNVLGSTIPFSAVHTHYAFMFIAAAHSVQYLWITTYYAKREPTYRTTPRYLTQTMLAGSMIWTLPALAFGPSLLGTVAYNDGLVFLVAAVVNLHHFVLDGAVWKLRDGRVAKILLRSDPDDAGSSSDATHRPWVRPAVWAVGLVCFVIAFSARFDAEFGIRRAAAAGDVDRMLGAVTRLAFIGRDHASNRRRLGIVAAKNDRDELALEQLHKSIALKPQAKAWFEIGHIHAKRQDWPATVEAYEAAYALESSTKVVIGRLAWALIYNGDPERAIEVLREGLRIFPDDPKLVEVLEHAEQQRRADASSAMTRWQHDHVMA